MTTQRPTAVIRTLATPKARSLKRRKHSIRAAHSLAHRLMTDTTALCDALGITEQRLFDLTQGAE